MPILVDDLSVWDIGFRIAGHDPRKFYFRVPLEVEDHFRNLVLAIHTGELACITISLEKRRYEPDEKKLSIYYWLDSVLACAQRGCLDRKLLHWALIERVDFMLWCERRNIPLPEFWFPPEWNLDYELPEGDLYPGYGFETRHWTQEQREAFFKRQDSRFDADQNLGASTGDAAEKLRPNQEARIGCQQIARAIWQKEPDRTIASVVRDELIQEYGGGKHYVDTTVREWVKVVAPSHVSDRRGRPLKNGGENK